MTHTESPNLQKAVAELERLGYPRVKTEVVVSTGTRPLRADLVAWERGEHFEPAVVVEISPPGKPATGQLGQLSRLATLLGAPNAYVYNGEQWLEADSTFTQLTESAGPPVSTSADGPSVMRSESAYEETRSALWKAANLGRGDKPNEGRLFVSTVRALVNDLKHNSPDVTLESVFSVLDALTEGAGRLRARREYGIRKDVARAMARLSSPQEGNAVLDPFCGIGGCLWAMAELSDKRGMSVSLTGIDINSEIVEAATQLARLTHNEIDFRVDDALRDDMPAADRIVTVPPWAFRLPNPVDTPVGPVSDGEIAAVDRSLKALKPGGRLVMHLSRGFLFRRGRFEIYRQWLAEQHYIVAVIGLPSGLGLGTSVPSAFVVIDKREPRGRSVVADLRGDWEEQLAPEGEVLEAILARDDDA